MARADNSVSVPVPLHPHVKQLLEEKAKEQNFSTLGDFIITLLWIGWVAAFEEIEPIKRHFPGFLRR